MIYYNDQQKAVYKGDLHGFKRNGKGHYYSKGKEEYTGSFINDKFEGKGEIHEILWGYKYVGGFEENMKTGYGTRTYDKRDET